jgi:hypothetical protein
MLANDKSLDVRVAVTKNAAVPYGLLFLLAADNSAAVRFAIAASEKTPSPILHLLTRDAQSEVAQRAVKTLYLSDNPEPQAA